VVALIAVSGIGSAIEGGEKSNESSKTTAIEEQSGSEPQKETTEETQFSESQEEATEVNKNSRAYIEAVRRCQTIVGILVLDIREEKRNTLEIAEETTGARDTCESVDNELLEMETDHFDEEASLAWGGVDEVKSGLNALLTWIDNPEPTKLIEARDKLQEGSAAASAGVQEINRRRHEYSLPPVHV
jgi:hypothetical protein